MELVPPEDKARSVEEGLRGDLKDDQHYKRLSFEPLTVSGYPMFEWIFELDNVVRVIYYRRPRSTTADPPGGLGRGMGLGA